jgi:hypothetical protein
LHENGTLGLLAISPEPLEHVTTLVFRQAIIGEVAITHLLERGHERIVVLLPTEPEFAEDRRGRLGGAQATAAERGATVLPVHAPCDPVRDQGGAAARLEQRAHRALRASTTTTRWLRPSRCPRDGGARLAIDSAPARRARLSSILLADPARWQVYVARLHALIEGEQEDHAAITDRPKVIQRAST